MFGNLRRRVVPSQKPLGLPVPGAIFDPSILAELDSPAAGYPELKSLMSDALYHGPTRTNAILAKGLAALQRETNSTAGLSPLHNKERS